MRAVCATGADQGRRFIVRIRNQADVVEHVQLPCLRRDVRGREAVAGIGVVAFVDLLGQHLAVACVVKPVNEAAAKAGEPLHFHGREPRDGGHAFRALQHRQQVPGQAVDRGQRFLVGGGQLELDDVVLPAAVGRDFHQPAGGLGLAKRCRRLAGSQQGLPARAQLRDGRCGCRRIRPVVAVRHKLAGGCGQHRHESMGLYRAGYADGFISALGEVGQGSIQVHSQLPCLATKRCQVGKCEAK